MTNHNTTSRAPETTEWQRHDSEWFRAHPQCRYHLRKPFPGEYTPKETPPGHAWLSLVFLAEHMTFITEDGPQDVKQIEHGPVAPVPANGFDRLMDCQATPEGQEVLRDFWNGHPKEEK